VTVDGMLVTEEKVLTKRAQKAVSALQSAGRGLRRLHARAY